MRQEALKVKYDFNMVNNYKIYFYLYSIISESSKIAYVGTGVPFA